MNFETFSVSFLTKPFARLSKSLDKHVKYEKYKAFLVIFKGLLVFTSCHRSESGSLNNFVVEGLFYV